MSEEYLSGTTIRDALSMIIRLHNELHDIVMILQNRVLALELQVRCTHLFKKFDDDEVKCIYCDQMKDSNGL